MQNSEIAESAIHLGAEDYIVKGSFTQDILVRSIRYAIERKKIKFELEQVNQTLQDMLGKDPLTGLLNRRGLWDVLMKLSAQMKRTGDKVFVLLLDLDDFKNINDSLGYGAGDVVLKQVAQQLTDSVKKFDHVSRIGGDEFVILLVGMRYAESWLVAERIRSAVEEVALGVNFSEKLKITTSMAGILLEELPLSLDTLFEYLHPALHQSKEQGKNKLNMCSRLGLKGAQISEDPSLKRKNIKDIILGNENKFYPVYHAVQDLRSKKIVAYEILCRLDVEEIEFPDIFLSFARQNHFLTAVDLICLKACIQGGGHFSGQTKLHLNLFPQTLMDVRASTIIKCLRELSTEHSWCIELSEQQMIGDPSHLLPEINALKEAGVRFAIDDLGYGHSSLESLVVLEPDLVKIDRSCVTGIAQDKIKRSQLNRLLRVLKPCGCEIIAEGVETEEDASSLLDLGVDYGQGFLFGKPNTQIPI